MVLKKYMYKYYLLFLFDSFPNYQEATSANRFQFLFQKLFQVGF